MSQLSCCPSALAVQPAHLRNGNDPSLPDRLGFTRITGVAVGLKCAPKCAPFVYVSVQHVADRWQSSGMTPAFMPSKTRISSGKPREIPGPDVFVNRRSSVVVSDSNASWSDDELAGKLVQADTAYPLQVQFLILGNTAITLTIWAHGAMIQSRLTMVPAGGRYRICDCHISGESPCVGADDPNGNYAGQTDMDGQHRVMRDGVEIGADEVSDFRRRVLPSGEWQYCGAGAAGGGAVGFPARMPRRSSRVTPTRAKQIRDRLTPAQLLRDNPRGMGSCVFRWA
jgi:hypothetical protein